MEWLQSLTGSDTAPALTAFLLGLMTAVSPCPLATNIAAIGFIGRNIGNRRRIFRNGLLYALGRVIAYTLLGIVLILLLQTGTSLFGIQKFIGKYGQLLLGPLCCASGSSCFSETGCPFRRSDTEETANPSPAAADGVPYGSECCSPWRSVLPAACSISAC